MSITTHSLPSYISRDPRDHVGRRPQERRESRCRDPTGTATAAVARSSAEAPFRPLRRRLQQDHLHGDGRGADVGHLLPASGHSTIRQTDGHRGGEARHFRRRTTHRPFRRFPRTPSAYSRRVGLFGRVGQNARGKHHQTAEYLGIHSSARRVHRGTAGKRY